LIKDTNDHKNISLTPDRAARIFNKVTDDPINKSAAYIDAHETSQGEVKDILLRRMKNFRDLIILHQKKQPNGSYLVPLQEFKTILRTLGIFLSNEVSYFDH
jgi:hypothetical protein